jgi:para-nitrobenzyl esterase
MNGRKTLRLLAILPLLALGASLLVACGGSGNGTSSAGGATPTPEACGAGLTPGPGLVLTDQGAVQGVKSGDTYAFKGIPFAQPPVGDLRYQPPQPLACSSTTLVADTYANECPQLSSGKAVGNEDCLYLNVWQPSDAESGSPKPVLFFIHGGGNVQGSTSQRLPDGSYQYDGEALSAAGDVIVVTVGYRLGPLGWLADPALSQEGGASSGNLGLLDQTAALQWVQRNIGAFGGDPSRVMVFGESAGAVDTCSLVASPLAKGLFSRALMESGGCVAIPTAQAEAAGEGVVSKAGCASAGDVAACMRELSVDAIMAAGGASANVVAAGLGTYGPVIDGYALKGEPGLIIAAGQHNHVPMVIGSNSDETSTYVQAIPTCDAYAADVQGLYGPVAASALQHYPCDQYATPQKAFIALTSDARFICTARRDAKSFAMGQSEPVFRYVFTHGVDTPRGQANGAFHGLELLWVFQHLDVSGYTPSQGEVDLANAILRYWTRLAATGDPNAGGVPTWPQYDAAMDPYLDLNDTIQAGSGYHSAQCDFWDGVVAQLLGSGP